MDAARWDGPPVSTMDSAPGLARVIIEMRNEIQKLESENRALRGKLDQRPAEVNSGPHACQHRSATEDRASQASLRRNVSAPALEGQYQDSNVRRYSISTDIRNASRRADSKGTAQRDTESLIPDRLQEGVRGKTPAVTLSLPRDESSSLSKEELNNKRSLHDYVHKNRTKVKTVTFLLPVEDIYTAQPVLKSHLSNWTS
ncbi:uncharacterized protein LOC125727073 isoform X2 [Brienomyrus brachyistius]|uniref:uncharacterized protein LOC125727073 isoform X2 n=1 Tax=Brienomyrus brachyistius TaxID=42636 RepID=UPI0020B310D2|nr:uncharacterized protein LOC125727073 isoform X2 [Brienomyrus brachyistius]